MFKVVCAAKVVTQLGPSGIGKIHAVNQFVLVELGIIAAQNPTASSLECRAEGANGQVQSPSVLVDSFLEFGGEIVFVGKIHVFGPASGIHHGGCFSVNDLGCRLAFACGKPAVSINAIF